MADEVQTLVQNEVTEENVIIGGNREPRTMTCNRRNVVPALSIFVALLIAGQAVSVYFITQQQGKINELDVTTKQLKLSDMINKLPGSPPSQIRPKLRMVSLRAPMTLRVDDDGTRELMEQEAIKSNSVGDAVEYMLMWSNPQRKYPSLNSTVLENLRKLRRSLSYEEWTVFEGWMQQWYLLYLVQDSRTPEATPAPKHNAVTGTSEPQKRNLPVALGASWENLVYPSTSYSSDSAPSIIDETPSGSPLQTRCQEEAKHFRQLGGYVPQCNDNGDYIPMQCWKGTGYCWCVYRNGTEVPETRVRARLDCSVFNDLMMDDMFAFEN